MTGYVADLSWKSGARAIEKLDRLRSTMAVNVLIYFISHNKPFYIEGVHHIYQTAYLQDFILNWFRLESLKCKEEEESKLFLFCTAGYSKGEGFPQQAEVPQGVPGRLRPRIFLTFGTTRVVGRQP